MTYPSAIAQDLLGVGIKLPAPRADGFPRTLALATDLVTMAAFAAASINGYGAALTSTGAAYPITATGPSDGQAHAVTIKNNSANSHAGKTFTVVGTDATGAPLSEPVTGPVGSATVTSTGLFKTVTSVTPSASTGADTFDIGWAGPVALSLSFAAAVKGGYDVVLATLVAAITLLAPTNIPAAGVEVALYLTQDATGGRTPTWNAAWKGATLTASGTTNQKALVKFRSDGTNLVQVFSSGWYS